ncbi:unnamed protein product [Rhizoctonia solani]|uniref:Uncharacterized protein n=1 Tax=Rhizoctonia solani TaxID=456999 RepID=A0A8H3CHX7_9AGAM|nr:unnamed protein product [Rhizoctonia solani]
MFRRNYVGELGGLVSFIGYHNDCDYNGLPNPTPKRMQRSFSCPYDDLEYAMAAIPPMMAMIALIIIMYILNSGIWATFIYDISTDFSNLTDESNRISGKLFVLSLLIALAGREHAANKLKQYQMEFKPLGQSSDCD